MQIQKQSVYSYRFQVADDEYGHNITSVMYLAVEITETANETGFLRQIFHTNYFNYQD